LALPFDDTEYARWLEQADATLQEGRGFAAQGLYHWGAFAAQQVGEAAAKALVRGLGKPVVTHSMKQLFDAIERLGIAVPEDIRHAGRVLERHYKGPRYPDEFASGTPRDHYDAQIASEALDLAERVVEFVKQARGSL
jgi:HEPN domain-containing protein